jgi:hypothetical protein
MPAVHDGAPETALQLFPMLPPVDAQFDPLQQRLGCGGVWGAHVRPGAQLALESQRQPWLPMMQVVGAPEPAFMPPSLPPSSDPSLFPVDPSLFPVESPPLPASELDAVDAELPHPQIVSRIHSGAPTALRPTNHVRLGMTLLAFPAECSRGAQSRSLSL